MRSLHLAGAGIALALAGCAVNGALPAPGWPKLDERVHVVAAKDMRDRCQPVVPAAWAAAGSLATGCAFVDLCERRCDVWIPEEAQGILGHEIEHCRGYDHLLESTMSDLLGRAKALCPERLL